MALNSPGSFRRPLRLTYLITDLNVGGVPLHLYRLATRLPADDFRVRVISLANEGPIGARLRSEGISVDACYARSVWDLRALWRLGRLFAADRPDVLHSLLFHSNMAARIIGPIVGVPPRRIVSEIQTVEYERRWHLLLDNLTCRLCRFEVGNSPSVVGHLHQHAHIPMTRLRCELGGVDVGVMASAKPVSRESLGVGSDESLIIWTGRLDPVKGFEDLLSAFREVSKQIPSRLLIVGDGPYRAKIERLISWHRLSDRVLMLGMRDDVPSLLKASDMFVLCSHTEGLSNSLLEAMSAGLPVVATDVSGCRDIVRDGETGFLVRAGSVESIAGGMISVLGDRSQAREMGRRAEAWVRENMNIGRMVERWVRLYELLCDNNQVFVE